ncbi:MAG: MFS transporter, partial [candidate division Zixibacteria bacterium]|nr:MFS transporter [candidate division Zixibacteria bacterium]
VTAFLVPLMGSSINVALPAIAAEFAMDAIMLSWVATAFLLTSAIFLLPVGRFADIFGRKKVFTVGMVIYALSSALSAFATSGMMLIAFRVLQGFGAAMIFGTGIAILTSVYPLGERGRVLGINVAAVYSGLSLGPFFGGFMTEQLGWRSLFLAHVPIGLIVIVVIIWKLKGEWAEAKGEKFDITGAVVYGLALLASMYGVSLLPELLGVWLIAFGLIMLLLFILWENRMRFPLLDIRLFTKNRVFAFSSLAAFIHYGATFAVSFMMSLYLQYIKGLSPQEAGLVLVCQPVVMAFFSPLAGRLSDRIEPRFVASSGMAVTAVGLGLLTSVGNDTSLTYVISALLVLGLGLALFSSPNTNAIMSSVNRRLYGVASGTVGTMRTVGQVISMGIAMLVFAFYIGHVEITPDKYPHFLQSARLIFIIFAVMSGLGIMASMARGDIRNQQSSALPADHNIDIT